MLYDDFTLIVAIASVVFITCICIAAEYHSHWPALVSILIFVATIAFIIFTPSEEAMFDNDCVYIMKNKPACLHDSPESTDCLRQYKEWKADSARLFQRRDSRREDLIRSLK